MYFLLLALLGNFKSFVRPSIRVPLHDSGKKTTSTTSSFCQVVCFHIVYISRFLKRYHTSDIWF
jgi:hypothetical protein